MKHYKLNLAATTFLVVASATPALAQTAGQTASQPSASLTTAEQPAHAVEEVVVTAQKRSENVEKVPASIVAYSGSQLTKSGTNSVLDLEKIVPSFQLYTLPQAAGVTLVIRGFGTSSNAAIDPDVAAYIDGIYIPRPGAILTSFLDLNTVEVLRGPQGTLFGRNATVGAIELTTNAPSFSGYSGSASTELASYATYKMQAVVNMPVNDSFALRAAVNANGTAGYEKDDFDNKTYGANNTQAGRLSAKWAITPSLTWIGRVDAADTVGDGVALSSLSIAGTPANLLTAYQSGLAKYGGGASFNGPSLTSDTRYDSPSLRDHQIGVSSDLTWNIGQSDYKVRLIDSYRDWNDRQQDGELTQTTLDLYYRNASFTSDSQSHELQFISPKDTLLGGRLSYVTGLYYFRENYGIDTTTNLGSQWCPVIAKNCAGPLENANVSQFTQTETSYAGYAQADFKINPALILSLGGRLTDDDKQGKFNNALNNPAALTLGAPEVENDLHVAKTQPTYRVNLTWNISPSVLTYASYTTGYKSGGFNSASSNPALTDNTRTFAQETSDNYELGAKAVLLDHQLLLNADIYQMDINNFQARAFNGNTFIIENSGNIRSRGLEVDGQYNITHQLSVSLGADYLDSIFTSDPTAPGLPGCSAKIVNSCVGYEDIVNGNPTVQNLTGRPGDYAPKYQANLAVEYDTSPFLSGYTLQYRPDISYVDSFYTTNDDNPEGIVKSNILLDLRVNLVSPSGRWTVTAYGTNLAGRLYYLDKVIQPLVAPLGGTNPTTGAGILRGVIGSPRTFGIRLAGKF